MLRREADGVAWWLSTHRIPARTLGMWWTARTPRVEIPRRLPEIVEILRETVAELGVRLAPSSLHAGVSGRTSVEVEFSDAGFAHIAELFDREYGGRLVLELAASTADGRPRTLSLTFFGRHDEVWNGTVRPQSAVGVGWCDDESPDVDEHAEAWTEALARITAACAADWGCVSLDHWSLEAPPYDYYYTHRDRGESGAGRHPRGYYWANVLNPDHVELLGGVRELEQRAHAAGIAVRELGGGDGPPYYLLRDPGPISAFADDRLTAMRDLLEASLLEPEYTWYAGPPLRVLKQHGTAFAPIPAGVRQPVFDDDESWDDE